MSSVIYYIIHVCKKDVSRIAYYLYKQTYNDITLHYFLDMFLHCAGFVKLTMFLLNMVQLRYLYASTIDSL